MDAFILQQALMPHSCFPSCGINQRNELVILRPIVPGEKLTLDYSTLFTGYHHIFHCNCGCNGCRKKILGFDLLPLYFQEFYLENDAVPGSVLKVLMQLPDFNMYPIEKRIHCIFYWLS